MPPLLRRRAARVPSVLAVAVLAATVLGQGLAPGASAAPAQQAAVPPTTTVAAPDFASEVFADPWDFSGTDDVLLDGGPTLGLRGARVADGALTFAVDGPGYFSPLWGGYPGSLFLGRDGSAPANRIDAGRYTRLSFSLYASQPADAAAFWWNCEGLQDRCGGGTPFGLRAGWNTYDVLLDRGPFPALQQDWAGSVHGLRFAVTPTRGPTTVAVDWLRLYQPGQAAQLPAGTTWDTDDDPSDNTAGNPGWGTLPTGDTGALPAGTYAVREPGAPAASGPLVVRERARPVLLDPDAVGGADYSAPDPWDFNGPDDVATSGNAGALSYGDRLSGRNSPPVQNDPFVWLRLRYGAIDPGRFHRLTVLSGYDGAFDLRDTAGGGTNARVVWQRADQPAGTVQQTDDLVTYSGTCRLTLDLQAPGTNEPEVPGARPWATAPVTGLRWDPNEDRGPRTWSLDRVALRADDEAGSSFTVRWVDAGFAPGSTVTFYRDGDASGYDGRAISPALTQRQGTNSFTWDSSATPAGTHWLYAVVSGPAGDGRAYATGAVQVRRGLAGQAASRALPVPRDLTSACPQGRVPEDGLGDVPPGTVHEQAVDCLRWWGVTTPAGGYQPAGLVNRGQMASFLARVVRSTGGSLPAAPSTFSDTDGNVHVEAIGALAAAGVTGGFADGTFRPDLPVTRAQMATFLVRAAEVRDGGRALASTADFFSDDGGVHAASVDKAASAGIAGGVLEGRYGAAAPVRRDQMASFVARLLDHLVAGGLGTPPAR